jgi:hypothetical protein
LFRKVGRAMRKEAMNLEKDRLKRDRLKRLKEIRYPIDLGEIPEG